MYLLIIMLPLLSALFSGFGGRWLGCYGSGLISVMCLIISTCFSILIFYEIGFGGSLCCLTLLPWIECGLIKVNWGFLFDSLTAVMLFIITLISSLVHIYSVKYMENDPHVPRFMSFLGTFTFFMLILVSSDNLIQMFLGWEGVGLSSYLLINFWYSRLNANQSAIKALMINRVGDYGLSLAIFAIFFLLKSLDYAIIFPCIPLFSNHYIHILGFEIHTLTLIMLFIFLGASGKSAQLGLHIWLPDAMEGPTPVSALIHAATMVTAGVFLLVRFSFLLEYSSFSLFILTIFGSLTALFASITGTFQNDLKKVIAYSTCSQLGYMILACGLSYYNVSIFHLINHAFFKALLFLSAGSVIHTIFDEQDMRRMGSLIQFLPLTYSLMLISSLSLAGFPFLTGFYSKDFIIELTYLSTYSNLYLSYGLFSYWLASTTIFFTSFYSFRLLYLTFINNSNIGHSVIVKIYESSVLMLLPLILLAFGSIFMGYFTKDLFIGLGTTFWGASLFSLTDHSNMLEAEWLDHSIKWLPFLITSFAVIFATLINSNFHFFLINSNFIFLFQFFLSKKWYWDKIFNILLFYPLLKFGFSILFKTLDKGFIELSGPYILPKLILSWSNLCVKHQMGWVTHYIFFIVLGIMILVCFILYPFLINFTLNPYLNITLLLLLLFL